MLRKKWLSFLVAVSMVAAMLPTTAFAQGGAVPGESTTTVVETATGENEQQNTEGEKSEGETSEDEKSDDGKSEGEVSEGEKSEGEKSEGETSEDEKSDDGKSEGEVSEEEKSEGETNEDETPEPPAPETPAPETPAPETPAPETPAANSIMLMNENGEGEAGEHYAVKVDDKGYDSFAVAFHQMKDGSTITLYEDVKLNGTLKVTAANTTFDLNGHRIWGEFKGNLVELASVNGVRIKNGTLEGGSKHTLNVWNAKEITLENLTLDNSKTEKGAPLIVGASEVTLEGEVTAVVADASWYAVNVDSRKVGEDAVGAKLTVNGKLAFDSDALTQVKCGICIENNAGTSPDDVVVEISDTATLTANSDKLPHSAFITLHENNKFGAIVNEPVGRYPIAGAVAISGSQAGNRYYTDFVKAIADVEPDVRTNIWMLDNVELDAPIEIPQGADIIVSGFTNDSEGNGVKLEIRLGDGVKTAFNNTDDLANHTEGLKRGTKLQFNDVSFHGPVDGEKNGYAAIVSDDNVQLNFIDCAFTDLYSALYCNAVMKDTVTPSTITITGSSFTNVAYSYGVDDGATSGANADSYTFVLENNEDQPEPATFAVAVVNGRGYNDLQKAVDALSPDGGTIELKKDVTLTAPVEVPKGMNLTVEGNGHTITLPKNAPYSAFNNTTFNNTPVLEGLKAGTDLNVNNVKFVGDVDKTNSGHAVVIGFEGGVDVNMTNCTFKNLYDAVYANPVANASADLSSIVISGEFDNVWYSYNLDNVGGRIDKYSKISVSAINGSSVPAPQSWGVAAVNNVGYATLEEALKAAATAGKGAVVQLLQDVQLDSKLVINTEGLQLDLNGHTISASDDFKNKGHLVEVVADGVSIVNGTIKGNANVDHALHVWNADNVKLGKDLVLDNAATKVGGAPLVIGASNVTLEGNTTFVTGENSWYGANVDSSKVGDKKEGSSLTVNGNIVFEGKNQNNAGIWVEDSKDGDPVDMTVSFGENSSAQGNGVEGFKIVHIEKRADGSQPGTVTGAENAGLITDENGNYVVKPAPAPQPQQPAGGSSHKHNYTWQHSDDEHWQYCADCGQAISNGPHTLQWKDGYQECTVCGYRVGSSTAAAPAAQASAPAAAAPAAPAAPAAAAIPQTGDASNPMLWVVLLAVSGSALGALVYTKKKREE